MSDRRCWIAHGAAATAALGELLGRHAFPGLVIALTGELGAGKTTFVQGLARGLDVPSEAPVTSPTFALVQQYPGRLPLTHVDAYRIRDITELRNVDADEWLAPAGVAVIEWADRIRAALPEDALWCHMKHRSLDSRRLEISWTSLLQNSPLIPIICDAPPITGLEPVSD